MKNAGEPQWGLTKRFTTAVLCYPGEKAAAI